MKIFVGTQNFRRCSVIVIRNRLAAPATDDEGRRPITSLVADGERVGLIDDISGWFGSASPGAALTGIIAMLLMIPIGQRLMSKASNHTRHGDR